ncbi:MAG: hypothetical protein NVSMB68_00760 [Thermoanaerobaculia bacterium]
MRGLFIAGVILTVLGIASLFVPIPHQERHGFDAGPVSVGVTTTRRERVSPVISGVLIAGGVVMMVAGGAKMK